MNVKPHAAETPDQNIPIAGNVQSWECAARIWKLVGAGFDEKSAKLSDTTILINSSVICTPSIYHL